MVYNHIKYSNLKVITSSQTFFLLFAYNSYLITDRQEIQLFIAELLYIWNGKITDVLYFLSNHEVRLFLCYGLICPIHRLVIKIYYIYHYRFYLNVPLS